MAMREDSVLVIAAGRGQQDYWRDLWRHRELLILLARRELLVRYGQMAIGMAWVLLKPALVLLILTLVFGRLANLPSDGMPYPILVLAGLLPWLFLTAAMSDSAESLISNSNLLTKVYFPRAILPASSTIVCLIDLLVAGMLLVPLMMFYGVPLTWRLSVLPLLVMLLYLTALGLSLWLAALHVMFRDFRYITPLIVQLSLYASPVGYASSLVPEKWRMLFYLNPLAGIIDGFRWALLGGKTNIHLYGAIISVTIATVMLVGGMMFFRKAERGLADRL